MGSAQVVTIHRFVHVHHLTHVILISLNVLITNRTKHYNKRQIDTTLRNAYCGFNPDKDRPSIVISIVGLGLGQGRTIPNMNIEQDLSNKNTSRMDGGKILFA
jgi:hypothetical protein